MRKLFFKNFIIIAVLCMGLFLAFIIITSDHASAGSYDGQDLTLAILKDDTTYVNSSYEDNDQSGHRQEIILSSLGTMAPTDESDGVFALLSTGIAGNTPVTTNAENPGDERGTWFRNRRGNPRDFSELTMTLQVPLYMHYLYYDVQFLSAEYPEYVGTKYNDKLTITVVSPSQGTSEYEFSVNNGYFVLDSHDIAGTGFDIFAPSGDPSDVDEVDTTPRTPGADAGASNLISIGGDTHPVSPGEQIIVTIRVQDKGDNMFDSAAFIDNLRFSGYAKTEIVASKKVYDLNGGEVECGDTLRYEIAISNTGTADQNDNTGNEFEDYIPENTVYVNDSASSDYGTISYDSGENKITWNGDVPGETTRILEFKVTVNDGLSNGVIISNQGTVYWDSDGNDTNDAEELTDNPYIDDGIDQDGDGETDDDDPTEVTVFAFDNPSVVTEDFSDNNAGGNATQYYLSRKWFATDDINASGSWFEVVPSYHYSSANSFKTKLRQSDEAKYWNYYLSTLENATMEWWEIWFACGDTSEEYNLSLDLQNDNDQNIARIRFKYVNEGTKPMDWILELYYYDPIEGWCRLNTPYYGGYLRNNWYKLRIEKDGANSIIYTLSMTDIGEVANETGGQLSTSFSEFGKVKFSSNMEQDPTVCPMFFWDEHSIGLTYPT